MSLLSHAIIDDALKVRPQFFPFFLLIRPSDSGILFLLLILPVIRKEVKSEWKVLSNPFLFRSEQEYYVIIFASGLIETTVKSSKSTKKPEARTLWFFCVRTDLSNPFMTDTVYHISLSKSSIPNFNFIIRTSPDTPRFRLHYWFRLRCRPRLSLPAMHCPRRRRCRRV